MPPLLPSDPSRIGPYRLLGRLGAGGMGVVYLGRAPGGALVAVKAIRSAYADDLAFRARFRREVRTAGRVRDPRVARLLDADAEGDPPWLATVFVPGPSLAEAVTECGPLPETSTAALGARLAGALRAVHGVGLVHRDVKPGNVLLALDGPRLIDFGIARAPRDTALTGTGAVVGSPGFLSPEQARGAGREVGPSADVFSLGCLLAYAATGDRPFGTGSPAAVLMRTVYREPDLARLPAGLLPLVRACLDKDPARRPDTARVASELRDVADPEDWAPEPVVRLIARHSVEALDLPPAPDTRPDTPRRVGAEPAASTLAAWETEAEGPRRARASRRRLLAWGAATAAAATAGTVGRWALASPEPPAGNAPGRRERHTVALHADLSGPGQAVGRAQERGIRIALAEINADSPDLLLDLAVHDDGGDPDRARAIADELTADDSVLALLGPTDTGCAEAVIERCQRALLACVSVSLGSLPVELQVQRVNVATCPSDEALAVLLAAHLVHVAHTRHTVLLPDAALGEMGWLVCAHTDEALGSDVRTDRWAVDVDTDTDGFDGIAARVVESGADAVVFVGTARRSASLAGALRRADFSGDRLGTYHAMTGELLAVPEEDTRGWLFAAPFLDPSDVASAAPFVAAYRRRHDDSEPPRYAAEAYDAAHFLARAVAELGGTPVERGGLVRQLRETRHEGVTKVLQWDPATSVYYRDAHHLFAVADGSFAHRGRMSDITA
ncbi:bifunctional serine/threonine-protein kinase/ABC transporter substrate-binding protein [Streptomyces sp. HSG2]|uniref:bifunctional serine/threonine-protein kinase/ABC transporter substrate-binding protein n=1 Tax=Streptomyces sp. HSG2 TaxID=2797167 RepID=UPI0019033910|nr:bifunctional serine/threonine-protein kinase/ABC transporter substrate-binding protein [Streptomyces sp. HSG2]